MAQGGFREGDARELQVHGFDATTTTCERIVSEVTPTVDRTDAVAKDSVDDIFQYRGGR